MGCSVHPRHHHLDGNDTFRRNLNQIMSGGSLSVDLSVRARDWKMAVQRACCLALMMARAMAVQMVCCLALLVAEMTAV